MKKKTKISKEYFERHNERYGKPTKIHNYFDVYGVPKVLEHKLLTEYNNGLVNNDVTFHKIYMGDEYKEINIYSIFQSNEGNKITKPNGKNLYFEFSNKNIYNVFLNRFKFIIDEIYNKYKEERIVFVMNDGSFIKLHRTKKENIFKELNSYISTLQPSIYSFQVFDSINSFTWEDVLLRTTWNHWSYFHTHFLKDHETYIEKVSQLDEHIILETDIYDTFDIHDITDKDLHEPIIASMNAKNCTPFYINILNNAHVVIIDDNICGDNDFNKVYKALSTIYIPKTITCITMYEPVIENYNYKNIERFNEFKTLLIDNKKSNVDKLNNQNITNIYNVFTKDIDVYSVNFDEFCFELKTQEIREKFTMSFANIFKEIVKKYNSENIVVLNDYKIDDILKFKYDNSILMPDFIKTFITTNYNNVKIIDKQIYSYGFDEIFKACCNKKSEFFNVNTTQLDIENSIISLFNNDEGYMYPNINKLKETNEILANKIINSLQFIDSYQTIINESNIIIIDNSINGGDSFSKYICKRINSVYIPKTITIIKMF